MAKIIKIEAYESGNRPPIQTWNQKQPPDGYAFISDELVNKFHSDEIKGHANIEVENGVVTSVTVNEEALSAFNELLASMPEREPEPVSEMEQLRADLDYIAIMTGVEL